MKILCCALIVALAGCASAPYSKSGFYKHIDIPPEWQTRQRDAVKLIKNDQGEFEIIPK